jgi:hypothetical protein
MFVGKLVLVAVCEVKEKFPPDKAKAAGLDCPQLLFELENKQNNIQKKVVNFLCKHTVFFMAVSFGCLQVYR